MIYALNNVRFLPNDDSFLLSFTIFNDLSFDGEIFLQFLNSSTFTSTHTCTELYFKKAMNNSSILSHIEDLKYFLNHEKNFSSSTTTNITETNFLYHTKNSIPCVEFQLNNIPKFSFFISFKEQKMIDFYCMINDLKIVLTNHSSSIELENYFLKKSKYRLKIFFS